MKKTISGLTAIGALAASTPAFADHGHEGITHWLVGHGWIAAIIGGLVIAGAAYAYYNKA